MEVGRVGLVGFILGSWSELKPIRARLCSPSRTQIVSGSGILAKMAAISMRLIELWPRKKH